MSEGARAGGGAGKGTRKGKRKGRRDGRREGRRSRGGGDGAAAKGGLNLALDGARSKLLGAIFGGLVLWLFGTVALSETLEGSFRGGPSAILSALAVLLVALPLGIWLLRRSVAIGPDGVLLREGLRSRYVARADIDHVEHVRPVAGHVSGPGAWWRVDLHLRSGAIVPVRTRYVGTQTTSPRWPPADHAGETLSLVLQSQLDSRPRADATSAELLAALGERGSRGVGWLRKLAGGGSYRAKAIAPAQLERLLGDELASPTARALADAVLRLSGHARRDDTLRQAADQFVHPGVRTALARFADATEEQAMAEAIEALQEQESRSLKR